MGRRELPFVRIENGLTVLYLSGERPYVIDLASERPAKRAALVEQDGLDQALLCLSSPLGIERLPRSQAQPLLDAYHNGVLGLDGGFGAWGAMALDGAGPDDVDHALACGCVGISLPAGALDSVDAIAELQPVLSRLELHGAPLLVHPGPGLHSGALARCAQPSLSDPLWWPALTDYVAGMQAAWLAFLVAGRLRHPELRVIFSMLAGLAPLHSERLASRGGPCRGLQDPLIFYDTSSYGHAAVEAVQEVVGAEQLLYGSDRPVLDPADGGIHGQLDWDAIADGTARALQGASLVVAR